LGDRGRLVLPAPLRERFDLHPGDRLIFTVDGDAGFRVVSARELAQRLHGMYAHLFPERSAVDELIAERRAEAQRELEE
jgi:AbrB family looped-hinge helix DNA binding protein